MSLVLRTCESDLSMLVDRTVYAVGRGDYPTVDNSGVVNRSVCHIFLLISSSAEVYRMPLQSTIASLVLGAYELILTSVVSVVHTHTAGDLLVASHDLLGPSLYQARVLLSTGPSRLFK